MIEPGDVDNPLTPGWVPDGWERGDCVKMAKGLYEFTIWRLVPVPAYCSEFAEEPVVNERAYHFPNHQLDKFFLWLEWWNYE